MTQPPLSSAVEEAKAAEWRPVPGSDGYEISSDGRVRTILGREISVRSNKSGYRVTAIRYGGSWKNKTIHSLVAEAWIGPRPDGQVIRHLDGDPSNNAPENLAYGTHQDNNDDRERHGRTARGERINHAKLTAKDVLDIRSSPLGCKLLGQLYEVNSTTILDVRDRKTWKHV